MAKRGRKLRPKQIVKIARLQAEGYSFGQISKMMRISTNTINKYKKQQSKEIEILKKELADELLHGAKEATHLANRGIKKDLKDKTLTPTDIYRLKLCNKIDIDARDQLLGGGRKESEQSSRTYVIVVNNPPVSQTIKQAEIIDEPKSTDEKTS